MKVRTFTVKVALVLLVLLGGLNFPGAQAKPDAFAGSVQAVRGFAGYRVPQVDWGTNWPLQYPDTETAYPAYLTPGGDVEIHLDGLDYGDDPAPAFVVFELVFTNQGAPHVVARFTSDSPWQFGNVGTLLPTSYDNFANVLTLDLPFAVNDK